jgi:ketosteroid isomerase-like protein
MSSREQFTKTARAWVQAHNDRNADAIKALTAPDFVAHFNPKSLPPQGEKDGEGYAQFQAAAFPMFSSYHASEVDLVVDESQKKVIVYLEAEGTAAVPGVTEPYKNQYVHKLTLTDDGKLVKVFTSFVDSQAMMNFMGKVFAAQAAGQGN